MAKGSPAVKCLLLFVAFVCALLNPCTAQNFLNWQKSTFKSRNNIKHFGIVNWRWRNYQENSRTKNWRETTTLQGFWSRIIFTMSQNDTVFWTSIEYTISSRYPLEVFRLGPGLHKQILVHDASACTCEDRDVRKILGEMSRMWKNWQMLTSLNESNYLERNISAKQKISPSNEKSCTLSMFRKQYCTLWKSRCDSYSWPEPFQICKVVVSLHAFSILLFPW